MRLLGDSLHPPSLKRGIRVCWDWENIIMPIAVHVCLGRKGMACILLLLLG